mgnify:CR=1 FL=1
MKKVFFIFKIIIFVVDSLVSQQNKVDSLFSELRKWEGIKGYSSDTMLFNIYYKLGVEFQNSNIDSSIHFLKKGILVARKYNEKLKEALCKKLIGMCYYNNNNYLMALQEFNDALRLLNINDSNKKDNLLEQEIYTEVLANIGNTYQEMGKYSKALEYFFMSLKINEKNNIKTGIARNMGEIGSIYYLMEDYQKAKRYFFISLKIYKDLQNKHGQAANLGNIGIIMFSEKNYTGSLNYYLKALKLYEEIENTHGQIVNLINVGVTYFFLEDFQNSIQYLNRAIEICKKTNDIYNLSISYENLGNIYNKLNKNKKAEMYYGMSIDLMKKINNPYYLHNLYLSVSDYYLKTYRYKEALEFYKKHIQLKDSLDNDENQKSLIQKEMEYEFEKKQNEERSKHQIEMAKKEEQNKRQKIVILFSSILLLTLTFFLYRINIQRRFILSQKKIVENQKKILEQNYIELQQKNKQIQEQKAIIEQKNKDIVDSITYAKRIQQTLLPNPSYWRSLLPNSFVFYLPKDIVAGDFYWLAETADYVFIAVADCTGHGVPGAMVSITCHNALNRVVLEEGITNTNAILDKTREIVVQQLHTEQEGQLQDGMDICLVRIDKANRLKIQYSGANRPLIIISDGQLKEYKADKQPIGYFERFTPFSYYDIKLSNGSCLYLFTDGFVDQFGGERNKKLGTKKWKELLLKIAPLPIAEQYNTLKNFYYQWKGEEIQIDDVTVIGMKLNC